MTKSIKELLTETKDFAVLAVDLSYCSVLFGSREIAKEVLKINDKVEALREEIERAVLRSTTAGIDESELIGILRLAAYSERIVDGAVEIAKKVLEGKIHEVEKKALKEAEEKFMRLPVDKELKGRTIAEIADIKNMWIIAIKRRSGWIYHPGGKVILKLRDVVFGIKQ